MAAAAGCALVLRSVAKKMTVALRASPLHHRLLLGGRRPGSTSSRQPFGSSSSGPSGSTPPPINDKNLNQNKNVPGELHNTKPLYVTIAPRLSYLAHFGTAAIIYFWMYPRLEELGNELTTLRRERSILIKAVEDCQREHIQAKDLLFNLCEAQSILGNGKESDGQKT